MNGSPRKTIVVMLLGLEPGDQLGRLGRQVGEVEHVGLGEGDVVSNRSCCSGGLGEDRRVLLEVDRPRLARLLLQLVPGEPGGVLLTRCRRRLDPGVERPEQLVGRGRRAHT